MRTPSLLCFMTTIAIGSTIFAASDTPRAKDRPPLGGSPRPLKLPQVQDTTLPNGLQVRVVEDHRFPLVTMKLVFRFGTTADPNDIPGLCESTAELLREGTAKMQSREIADELAAIGGSVDSDSGPDTVSLTGSSLSEFAGRLASLMAETTIHPSFPDSEVALRKENLKQELAQNRAQPSWLSRERFQKEIYGASPYAVLSPTDASIEKLDRSKVAEFHRRMFVPGSAVLVVVGDVDRTSALKEVTAAFGSWSGKAEPAPAFPAPPSRSSRRVYLVDRPGSVQSDLRVGNLGIPRKDPLYYSALMLDGVVGAGAASRLFLIVREEKGYTYDAHSEYATLRTSGDWSAVTEVRTEVTKPALEEVLKQVERMRSEKVTEAELTSAKNYAGGIFTLQVERPSRLATLLAEQKIFDLPADELETHVARVNAVTPEDLLKAAQTLCDTSHAAIVVVGDGSKIRSELGSFGPISVFNADGTSREVAP